MVSTKVVLRLVFFSVKLLAINAENKFVIKFFELRCLECSIWKIFFKLVDKAFHLHRFSIIGIAARKHKINHMTAVAGNQMQLKTIKPLNLTLPAASPSKTLWEWIRRLWHTRSGVESRKLMPVHGPVALVFK